MDSPIDAYWSLKLETVAQALKANRFDARVVADADAARGFVTKEILPSLGGGIVSWGGSLTLKQCGFLDVFTEDMQWDVLRTDIPGLSPDQKLQIRRQALLSDLYLLGANAVTEDGRLVNLDMIGNRVAALTFGPRKVIVVVGRNKIVPGLSEAMDRIRDYASPANSIRLDFPNPCVKAAECRDCSSDTRICNNWTITEKSHPPQRVSVILVNADLGL